MRKRSFTAAAAVAVGLSLMLAGCGSSGSTAKASGAAGAGSSSAGASGGYDALLQKAFDGEFGPLPSSTPKAPAGVSVWIVSCGQQAPACASAAGAAQQAASSLGWKATVCDGKLNPIGWGTCIRQGTAAHVKVIIPIAVDCPTVTDPLKEAARAGITTIAAGGLDCAAVGGPKVYTSGVQLLPNTSVLQWYEGIGRLAADWVIGQSKGKADVLELNFTDAIWGPAMSKGFETELQTCGGCKIARKLDLGNQDVVGGTLRSKFSTALLQLPSVNTVWVPIDVWMVLGLSQAIASSGRASSLKVIGALGDASNMDLIRAGTESASVEYDSIHYGYAGIDETIRVLDGQPTVPEGVGYQVVDKTHNLPGNGLYVEDRDIVNTYKKLWNVG
jgi:ribose transport system substrate-binding protein